jgi:hypothetical protein
MTGIYMIGTVIYDWHSMGMIGAAWEYMIGTAWAYMIGAAWEYMIGFDLCVCGDIELH